MAEIIRIVIKALSGYCCVDEAFNDKFTIAEDSISYDYVSYVELEINPKMKFAEIAKRIPEVIIRDINEFKELFMAIKSICA